MSYIPMSHGNGKIEARATNGYLGTQEMADLLQCCYGTVYNLINDGKLKADSSSYLYKTRKRVSVQNFKDFLNENPLYYSRVYGTIPETKKEEAPVVAENVADAKKTEPSDILTELFEKLEIIEKHISEHQEEINKLEAQKKSLEEVIDMF